MNHRPLPFLFIMRSAILIVVIAAITLYPPFAMANFVPAGLAEHSTQSNSNGAGEDITSTLPRSETLYFNGQQWGSVAGWNPYADGMNNALALAQQDNARVTVWETPYMFNMLDGQQYPLLADGPWRWNASMTEITYTLKTTAHWSDGTPVTAQDAAYTWATNLKYGTSYGNSFRDFIDTVEAPNPHTVLVKAKLDGHGKAVNPMMVSAFLSTNYVVQKAWTQTLEARNGGDANALKADPGEDFVASGPYTRFLADATKVVLIRDANYWGKDASMWGKLPAPKYLAHIIYPDNDAALAAFKAGEVDVSQQFIANVQNLWLVDHLPVSTYLPNAPYHVGASLPTAFYNLRAFGLNNPDIRKAIAIAIDYDTIIANAVTNQSDTFTQVPRSFMNPTAGEQVLYNQAAVAGLQWAGNDIAGAKDLLTAAGAIDTNGDGWREYNGQTLHYVATCPNGWSDWQAAITVLAAVGQEIGIDITTSFPEWSDYQTIVTNWPLPNTGFDIFMMWSTGAGPTQPWNRIKNLISSDFAGSKNNWAGNWGGYSNPVADDLINAIPQETDPLQLKADYTDLTRIYLTDVPSFALMYRPQSFHTVNETIWTGFPHQGDGFNPPIPPLDLTDGYSIAGLYHLSLRPTVTLNYTTGAVGSFFTVTGLNFPANSLAHILVNGHELGTIATDSTGAFTLILSTAVSDEGKYQVTVTVNPSASSWFTLQAGQPLRPQDGSGTVLAVPAGIAYHLIYLPFVDR